MLNFAQQQFFLLPNDTCILIPLLVLVKNCKKYVLSQFNIYKLLWTIYLFISLNISLFFNLNSVSSRFAIIKLVSSANKIGLDLSDTLWERSIIYIKNNNGPRMEPCGTPCCTSFHLERQSFGLL